MCASMYQDIVEYKVSYLAKRGKKKKSQWSTGERLLQDRICCLHALTRKGLLKWGNLHFETPKLSLFWLMPLHCVFLSHVSPQLHILCWSAVSSPFSDTRSRPTSSSPPTRSKTANNSDFLALVSRFEGCLCFPHRICSFFFWKCCSFWDVTFCVSWPKLVVWGTAFLFCDSLITFLSTAEIWAEDAHKMQVWWEEFHFHSGPRYQCDLCVSPPLGKLPWLNRQTSQHQLLFSLEQLNV